METSRPSIPPEDVDSSQVNSMNSWVQAVLVFLALVAPGCASDEPTERARPTAAETAPPSPTSEPTPTSPPDPFALAKSYEVASPRALATRLVEAEATLRGSDGE